MLNPVSVFLFFLYSALAAVTSAQTTSCPATDADRARWTMSDMHGWAVAVSAYHKDHGEYPRAGSVEELQAAVQPKYINAAPLKDAWGRTYLVRSEGETFHFASAGADGVFEEEDGTPAVSADFASDAVLQGGNQVRLVRKWEYR